MIDILIVSLINRDVVTRVSRPRGTLRTLPRETIACIWLHISEHDHREGTTRMTLFDNGFRLGTGVAIGIGALILAPVLVPVAAAVVRPLIKAGLKGSILLYEKSKEMIAETQELFEDLAAEVKAELAQEHDVAEVLAAAPAAATPE